jgi:hypothetical protein
VVTQVRSRVLVPLLLVDVLLNHVIERSCLRLVDDLIDNLLLSFLRRPTLAPAMTLRDT